MRYAATATITALALSSWEWSLPVALVLALLMFWREWRGLVDRVRQDRKLATLRREAAATLHFNCPAHLAWKLFVGGR